MDKIERLLLVGDPSLHKLKAYLSSLPLDTLTSLERHLTEKYTAGESEVEDWKYDALIEVIEEKDASFSRPTGAQIREAKNRVQLPYWLGSMDKFKPDDATKIARWVNQNQSDSYVVMSKLDGISCLMTVLNRKVKLYTRGDGTEGGDISHLIKYLKLPENLPNIAIRGEIIMKKAIFAEKHASSYANPRNMVAGLIGSKTSRNGLEDLEFVAYEIVDDHKGNVMPIADQLERLRAYGFKIVRYEGLDEVTIDNLLEVLILFKQVEEFEIDGIIVQANVPYDRITSGNPDYAFAFKMQGEVVPAKVIKVEWRPSKHSKLIPRIWINRTQVGGVHVDKAAAFNARYINDNGIGVGAEILITRSGDVIPFIVKVTKRAKVVSMPDSPWKWDSTNVNIMLTECTDELHCTICVKIIADFFTKLGIKDIKEGRIKALYDNGLVSLLAIIRATEAELSTIIGDTMGAKSFANIRVGLESATIPDVIGATGVLGEGIGRELTMKLFNAFPTILHEYKKMTSETLYKRISSITDFGGTRADMLISNLKWADKLIAELSKTVSLKKVETKSNSLQKSNGEPMKFVISGFRDAGLKKAIEDNGGKVVEGKPSKNTSGLIVKDKNGKQTAKPLEAVKLGIPVYDRAEFEAKFFL